MTLQEAIKHAQAAKAKDICSTSGRALAVLVDALESQPQEAQAVASDDGLSEFIDYFVKNYPGPDTIIHKPEWHAPKIFAAAKRAMLTAAPQAPAQADTDSVCIACAGHGASLDGSRVCVRCSGTGEKADPAAIRNDALEDANIHTLADVDGRPVWSGAWKDCPFPHNFGKPLGYAVITNADTDLPNMLDGGAHTFRRDAQAVADSSEYAGSHHVIELWPAAAFRALKSEVKDQAPVDGAASIGKARAALYAIANTLDDAELREHAQKAYDEISGSDA